MSTRKFVHRIFGQCENICTHANPLSCRGIWTPQVSARKLATVLFCVGLCICKALHIKAQHEHGKMGSSPNSPELANPSLLLFFLTVFCSLFSFTCHCAMLCAYADALIRDHLCVAQASQRMFTSVYLAQLALQRLAARKQCFALALVTLQNCCRA